MSIEAFNALCELNWLDNDEKGCNRELYQVIFKALGRGHNIPEDSDEITLYRGHHRKDCLCGQSWTDDIQIAEWFAGKGGYVAKVIASRDEVIGFNPESGKEREYIAFFDSEKFERVFVVDKVIENIWCKK